MCAGRQGPEGDHRNALKSSEVSATTLESVAYLGAFDRMFSILAEAERTYRQAWANAPRLST